MGIFTDLDNPDKKGEDTIKWLIINWLKEKHVNNYIINDDLTIDINGNVDLVGFDLKDFPPYIQFNEVKGDFICDNPDMISNAELSKKVEGNIFVYGSHKHTLNEISRPIFIDEFPLWHASTIEGSRLLIRLKSIINECPEPPRTVSSFEQKSINGQTKDSMDWTPIIELLGEYYPDDEIIKLYELNIFRAAGELGCNPDKLREIVFIHEFGHFIQHRMPMKESPGGWDTEPYKEAYNPIDLHEAWAQLMVEWATEGIKEYSEIFEKLVLLQPSAYRKYLDYTYRCFHGISKEDYYRKLFTSIDSLRKSQKIVGIEDWNKILFK